MDALPTGEYGLSAGIELASNLAAAGLYIFTADEAVERRPAGVRPSAVPRLLKSLADAGWIVRIRRGLYAGTGRLPGGVDVPPFAVATSLVRPSAVALTSALAHHGLTDQIPRVITSITPRRPVVPSMRPGAERHGPHLWHAVGLDFRYVVVAPKRFSFGLEMIWLDERFRVPITDRERTILDLFALPRLVGGLAEGIRALEQARGDIDIEKLVQYALEYGSVAVAKRLGWSLEEAGIGPAELAPLLALRASSFTALDPGRARRGRYGRRWMIIDNRAEDRA